MFTEKNQTKLAGRSFSCPFVTWQGESYIIIVIRRTRRWRGAFRCTYRLVHKSTKLVGEANYDCGIFTRGTKPAEFLSRDYSPTEKQTWSHPNPFSPERESVHRQRNRFSASKRQTTIAQCNTLSIYPFSLSHALVEIREKILFRAIFAVIMFLINYEIDVFGIDSHVTSAFQKPSTRRPSS